MTPVEQAKLLQSLVVDASVAFRLPVSIKKDLTEDEVKFRYDSIEGMLIMALNEARKLVSEFEAAATAAAAKEAASDES